MDLPKLREFHLDNNRVVSLQNLQSSTVTELEILSVRYNKVAALPILRHRKLKRVLLEGN